MFLLQTTTLNPFLSGSNPEIRLIQWVKRYKKAIAHVGSATRNLFCTYAASQFKR